MSKAIITLSRAARDLALAIKRKQPGYLVYTMPKQDCNDTKPIIGRLSEFVGSLFKSYDTLVFIMSTGIVVRTVAPYLRHKSIDPAVLVVDSNGEFVISLLSGHLGGANEKARELAKLINAVPVVTTASDINNKLAVDMFAKQNGLIISDFKQAKDLTSLIINDELIGIISDFTPVKAALPANVKVVNSITEDLKGLIYITNKRLLPSIHCPVVKLIKPNIVIGLGCKRGIESGHLKSVVDTRLRQLNIDNQAVKLIASVGIKKNELGIIELAKSLEVKFITYAVKELNNVEHLFVGSQFVKEAIGVAAVCEPAGYLASNKGQCLLAKEKHSGVTISLWQEGS